MYAYTVFWGLYQGVEATENAGVKNARQSKGDTGHT